VRLLQCPSGGLGTFGSAPYWTLRWSDRLPVALMAWESKELKFPIDRGRLCFALLFGFGWCVHYAVGDAPDWSHPSVVLGRE
jgi:hypothetical protein